jgi:hypothetical protein
MRKAPKAKNLPKTKDFFAMLEKQVQNIEKLAQKYAATKSEDDRNAMNQANLHLHGQVHVFWNAFDAGGRKTLEDMQKRTNQMVKAAAKANDVEVSYVDINHVRSKTSGDTAPNHIYQKLVHPDATSVKKLVSSVEKDILDELQQLGFDVDESGEFMRYLITGRNLLRGKKPKGRKVPTYPAQANPKTGTFNASATKELHSLIGAPALYTAPKDILKAVRDSINDGADVNAPSAGGQFLINKAVFMQPPKFAHDLIKLFAKSGADVNAANAKKHTALMSAASRLDITAMKTLIKYKADPQAMNRDAETALDIAERLHSASKDAKVQARLREARKILKYRNLANIRRGT